MGKARLASGGVTGKTFKLLLVNATGAAVADATKQDYNTVSQVVGNELANISGSGYARKTLTSITVTEDDSGNLAVIDSADPSLYASINAGTISGGWIFEVVDSTDANDLVWLFLDVDDIVTNGTDVTLTFSSSGGWSTLA